MSNPAIRTLALPSSANLLALTCLLYAAVTVTGCRSCSPDNRESEEPIVTRPMHSTTEHAGAVREELEPLSQTGDAALMFTSGISGYTEPCGCSEASQLGGIDRLVWAMTQRTHPQMLALDAGNTFFQTASLDDAVRDQENARADVIATALRHANVRATTPGPRDFAAGPDRWLELVEDAELTVVSTNMNETARSALNTTASKTVELGALSVRIFGATDPLAPEVDATFAAYFGDPAASLVMAKPDGADSAEYVDVLLFQGTLTAAREVANDVPWLEFIVVGQHSEPEADVWRSGDTYILTVQDQARALGNLRLIGSAAEDEGIRSWRQAVTLESRRAAAEAELSRVRRQIEALETRLGEGTASSPLLDRLHERETNAQATLNALLDPTSDEPAEAGTFVWHVDSIEQDFGRDDIVAQARMRFNEDLEQLNLANAAPPEPAAPGEPSYVGAQECMRCHATAYEHWQQTPHAAAIDTLIARDKEFDTTCVGCHVTGWHEPGGSTLGHTADLENVQCESCHGPGSLHATNPSQFSNVPGGVSTTVQESTCAGCHNEEHSPGFIFDERIPMIVGPGHGASVR